MSGLSTTFFYDQYYNRLIDGTNVASSSVTNTYPKIFRNDEHAIIRAYVYSDASSQTAADLSNLTFTAKIGRVGSTALITAPNANFNDADDWALANVAAGRICFYVNAAGSTIDSDIGTSDTKTYSCHIYGEDGDSDNRTVAQVNLVLINVPE